MHDQQSRVPHVHHTGFLRREILQVGILGAFGMTLEGAFAGRPAAAATRAPRAKRVIVVWMPGGPPQMQLWDLKPDSPQDCRGTAVPIATSADGVQIGSRLPRTARQAHLFSIVRTLTLGAEDENHIPGHQEVLSGINRRPPTFKSFATRNDWPSLSSVIAAVKPNSGGLPAAIHLPYRIKYQGTPVPGEGAGWLGSKHDPWFIEQDPNGPNFRVPDLAPVAGFTVDRLENRQRLLAQVDQRRRDLDRELDVQQLSDAQSKAFTVTTSAETRRALDLTQEAPKLRERYGRSTFGQSLLLGRRLAEAGVKYVQVNLGNLNAWDYHRAEDQRMDGMMPLFDQAFSAFLEDLAGRGLLEETLVVCTSEMGRNPVLGKSVTGAAVNASDPDGRNHWQWVWSGVFAGAGVRGGTVVGESDEWAGYPATKGFMPCDVGATIYDALGIDPRTEVIDIQGRPMVVNHGEVMEELYQS
ncbi:MAG: DUF1501 domain-containing protein [Armatimonadetes bacterium]|nr:DUF1501 domain-containing protein [Armatimonadota bacterium]